MPEKEVEKVPRQINQRDNPRVENPGGLRADPKEVLKEKARKGRIMRPREIEEELVLVVTPNVSQRQDNTQIRSPVIASPWIAGLTSG